MSIEEAVLQKLRALPPERQREVLDFVDCIERNTTPVADGEAGLRVVRDLEAATRSLAQRGALVELSEGGAARKAA